MVRVLFSSPQRILNIKKRGTACYSSFLKALGKLDIHTNRQQNHAGNQRRNRLCHSCVIENFLSSQEQE